MRRQRAIGAVTGEWGRGNTGRGRAAVSNLGPIPACDDPSGNVSVHLE
jgi:hypothetical protein